MKRLIFLISLLLSFGFASAQEYFGYTLGSSLQATKEEKAIEKLREHEIYTVYMIDDEVMDEPCQVALFFDNEQILQALWIEFWDHSEEKYAGIYQKVIDEYGSSIHSEGSTVNNGEKSRWWNSGKTSFYLHVASDNIMLEIDSESFTDVLAEE